ncbi:MAG: hypothetical protein UZ17_ACD001002378 [Acidobacteria bacterium OLB17]|nr:MAG: hypothetical protein UZ17_ACD001002378 [Acidobacteria bacterium OLB17]
MIVRTATARVDYKYSFFRELPNKYSYSLVSDAVGTAHAGAIGSETFFDGNVSLMGKTVVKGDDPRVDFYQPLIEVLSPGYFVSLSTSGVYTEDGEQKVFVKGENAAGEEVLLTFNAKTGLPMKAVLNGFDVRFSNYKTEGQVTLPLSVEYKAPPISCS